MNLISLDHEKEYWLNGYQYVAGIDEAGRGPLAGPLVCSSVIFNKSTGLIQNINDSKKLSKKQREYLFYIIVEKAISIAISIIDEKTIDALNIYQATILGMQICVELHSIRPDVALVDGMRLSFSRNVRSECIIKGDLKVMSIAAASIIAKVTRDNIMELYHKKYPQYAFNKNSGYPTKVHIQALKEHGVLNIHRKSYRPVRELL